MEQTTQNNLSEIKISYQPSVVNNERVQIRTALDGYKVVIEFYDKETIHLQEHFVVLYLNRANRVLGCYKVSTGGLTGTVADVRLILSVALKCAATGIILSHNHPSGNLNPSSQDIALTQKIKDAALFMDISVHDHIILNGEGGFYSMTDEGVI